MISSSVFHRWKSIPENVKFKAHFKPKFNKSCKRTQYSKIQLYSDMGKEVLNCQHKAVRSELQCLAFYI